MRLVAVWWASSSIPHLLLLRASVALRQKAVTQICLRQAVTVRLTLRTNKLPSNPFSATHSRTVSTQISPHGPRFPSNPPPAPKNPQAHHIDCNCFLAQTGGPWPQWACEARTQSKLPDLMATFVRPHNWELAQNHGNPPVMWDQKVMITFSFTRNIHQNAPGPTPTNGAMWSQLKSGFHFPFWNGGRAVENIHGSPKTCGLLEMWNVVTAQTNKSPCAWPRT